MVEAEEKDAAEVQKEARARKLFRRLESRNRLEVLAAEQRSMSVDEVELARLKRDYLPVWAALARGSAVGKGLPTEAPLVDLMRPTASWELQEPCDNPDPWVANVIEAAIMELSGEMPLGRAALTVRYLNAEGPAVYRHGRLTHLTMGEVEDLADALELALVPEVKRRGLPLW